MSDLPKFIEHLYEEYRNLDSGSLASYIPELTKANPNWFAISIVTKEGTVFEVGDISENFTIQSISKVFVYGMALEDCDRLTLLEKIGVEPTGDPFNSVIRLDENSKRPDNPMVNAGAIAHNIEEILDLYFQQCSVVVNCHDLAVMAATLANRGINPITQEKAIAPCYVRDILSVMYTCGMYNYAGEWAYKVGIPAKSGVSGGIIAVIPDRAGIAVYSPLIDHRGNSVRGIKVFEDLADKFQLHLLDFPLEQCPFLDISQK
ncbi:glutaminase [Waterburya agarophytonicola K14]|uniref:glutaminase n=1 Tax=Waterburya agarophytonicola KI4 TaxID=2874699 RepID=A0A964BU45_9CYAN|nr:glutaminase [Waterburya agarophytonicola]MCC0179154.1 glutaminase [Waterburya agarophytonicola KI4]